MLLERRDERVPPFAVAPPPYLDEFVGGAGVDASVNGGGDGVDGVVVGGLHRLHAAEVGAPPHFHAPVPRHRVEEGAVGGGGQRRHGVDVVDPRAPLVAADLHIAPRREQPHAAVPGGGQRGQKPQSNHCWSSITV